MSASGLPLILEPDQLRERLGAPELLVVDLCRPEVYAAVHVPGAVHLDYGAIVASRPPVGGLLPDAEVLARALSALGLAPEHHVVAYDDEGGGKAARLLWTLDVLGHVEHSLLNGGLHAWANEGHPVSNEPVVAEASDYVASIGREHQADKDYILARLEDPDMVLVDTRTPEEYRGERVLARHGGHIPGAVNMDWMQAMDQSRNLRLKPDAELRSLLDQRGVTPDKEIVTYCQTHHRSAHTYVVLKALGFPRLRGYPGAWSEWGNLPDTPLEV
ncbi:MAG: sulfurtransferase [Gammaproteobacteria bacterium]|nr:sulfurtransferase [Gammaproteobacteria bacterium]NIR84606.1 sulfurtransferase [Gammaproteobacteria bacterium]NIR90509.1 sulfurtransferase [Gammaproteobacteria bacterium]NIU05657.1 sulfurtransferase [Gammaproteobacteria bacterium]NIV52796.1 sulfurtransferase [Gammaproteobacteria bacterium]